MSPPPLPPGFMVIHGNQPELLRQLLVHWYRANPLAPLEDEVILVQSNGIAQWLKLALAEDAAADRQGGCGIAAALDLVLPSRFVWQAYRAVLGPAAVPETSPFDKPQLIWRLMRLLPALCVQPVYAPLARFLEADDDLRKRYQLAERIADLFDQYQVYRADWLDAWARGEDNLPDMRGQKRPLAAVDRWQAELWRALLADVGTASQSSRAAVHQRFLQAIAQTASPPAGLPRRISVFGLSSLPRQSLEVLRALARFTQVILCVHNPCAYYWADLLTPRDAARRTRQPHKAGLPADLSEALLPLHAQPLLAAWGKQGQDYIALLDELDQPEHYRRHFEALGERIDLFQPPGEDTLLRQLQDDILALRSTAETREKWPPPDPARDVSIRFHIAHSPQREVDILHDQLLAAFDADDTLRPRDILVMVPDVDRYAPHIAAVFGQHDPGDARHIPYTLADQTQRHQAPLLTALTLLLSLPESRLTVSEVLDLLDVPALRRRFGIAADDLPRLRQWLSQAGIRWGLDAAHRARLTGQPFAQNTWQHGLKRLLLGYAVGEDPTGRQSSDWQDIEPCADVAGLEAALVGPLDTLLRQLDRLAATLSVPASPAVWHTRLQALLADCFAGETPEDEALLLQLRTRLTEWRTACEAAALDEAIPLAVVREHWLAQIDQPHLGRRFLAGRLTFATLMPMRAIPFRMVCLLGMNDGDFPRSRTPVDFDLMAREVRPGDRSRRNDDRYLFLEALLSARDRLYISWVGRSVQDNAPCPPSVLVSQLRDHLAAGWGLAGHDDRDEAGRALLAALTTEHPLQPFSPAYFAPLAEHTATAGFTYAREWERPASPPDTPAAANRPLPPPTLERTIAPGQLAAFLKDPVRSFYLERLGVDLEQPDLASEDQEPFDLDGLARWSLQDELIQARLDAVAQGLPEAAAVTRTLARIRRRGDLPVADFATPLIEALRAPLEAMFDLYHAARARWPVAHPPLDVEWHSATTGLSVAGRLDQRYGGATGEARILLSASNLIDKQHYRRDRLLPAWVEHLVLQVAERPATTLIIGRNGQVELPPLPVDTASRLLDQLLSDYRQGLCQPLPVAPRTAFAWLCSGGQPGAGGLDQAPAAAVKAAAATYDSGFRPGEAAQSPYRLRAYPDFAHLWSDGAFSHWCDRLYAPLHTVLGQRTGKEDA